MIKSLRRKFILTNMLLVFVVLAVVFTTLCVTNSQLVEKESEMALHQALDQQKKEGPFERPKYELDGPRIDMLRHKPVFVLLVEVTGEARMLRTDSYDVSEADVQELADLAIQGETETGILRKAGLRYLKRMGPDGTTQIAFVSIYDDQQRVRSMVITSLLIMFGALGAFFMVSLFLSRVVVRPVELAWKQQKRFVADASHELKTPLTVILANTEILLANETETVEAQLGWVQSTQTEARQMKRLVDDLLFLAKSDDAKQPLQRRTLPLSEVVFGVALSYEALAFERGRTFDSDGIERGITLQGDEVQLRQVVGVLVDNALKYSAAGTAVTLTLQEKQGRAVLTVHNWGKPIAQEALAHVFERFYRTDKARSYGGYGLGLAIAQSIVTAHGGKIGVESTEEAGTTFVVSLPL